MVPLFTFDMLSLEEFKKLLGDEKISDAEAEKIRGACYAFAELALEVLRERKNNFKKEHEEVS